MYLPRFHGPDKRRTSHRFFCVGCGDGRFRNKNHLQTPAIPGRTDFLWILLRGAVHAYRLWRCVGPKWVEAVNLLAVDFLFQLGHLHNEDLHYFYSILLRMKPKLELTGFGYQVSVSDSTGEDLPCWLNGLSTMDEKVLFSNIQVEHSC